MDFVQYIRNLLDGASLRDVTNVQEAIGRLTESPPAFSGFPDSEDAGMVDDGSAWRLDPFMRHQRPTRARSRKRTLPVAASARRQMRKWKRRALAPHKSMRHFPVIAQWIAVVIFLAIVHANICLAHRELLEEWIMDSVAAGEDGDDHDGDS